MGADSFGMYVILPGGPASPCGPGKPADEEKVILINSDKYGHMAFLHIIIG